MTLLDLICLLGYSLLVVILLGALCVVAEILDDTAKKRRKDREHH